MRRVIVNVLLAASLPGVAYAYIGVTSFMSASSIGLQTNQWRVLSYPVVFLLTVVAVFVAIFLDRSIKQSD